MNAIVNMSFLHFWKLHKSTSFQLPFSRNTFCEHILHSFCRTLLQAGCLLFTDWWRVRAEKHLHRNRRFSSNPSNRQDNYHMQKKYKLTHWHSLLICWVTLADKQWFSYTYRELTNFSDLAPDWLHKLDWLIHILTYHTGFIVSVPV